MQVGSFFKNIASFYLLAPCLLIAPAWADPEMPAVSVSDPQFAKEGRLSFAFAHETSRLLATLDVQQDAKGIERLLQATRHPHPYIRYVGTWGLGKTDIPLSFVETVVTRLFTGLADTDPWVTMQSVESLKAIWGRLQHAHPSIIAVIRPAFLHAASAPNPWVRAKAAEGLYYWQEHRWIEKDLEILLHDPVPIVREEAYRFFPISVLPLNILLKGLRDESAAIRYMSLNRLRSYGYYKLPEVQKLVIERLRDPDEQIVYESVFFLTDYRVEAAIRPILDLLNTDGDLERVVKRAIAAYTSLPLHKVQQRYHWKPNPHFSLNAPLNFPDPEMMEQIVRTIDVEGELEKATALLQLAWVDSRQAEDMLKKALRSNNALARYTALEVLRTRLNAYSSVVATDVDFEDLVLRLKDTHPHVRKRAITIVGALHPRLVTQQPYWNQGRITKILQEYVETENDGFIKAAAVKALLRMKTQLAPDIVEQLLQDTFFQIREVAVSVTDLLQYPQLLKSVLSHFTDPNHRVRLAAVTQFIRADYSQQFQGNEKLVIALRRVATTDSDERVRTAAYQALGFYN